ncbi:MAG: hypothetical protein FWC16_03125 [Defluviitaleaceae bacterium]|nr:hypothetical protein [Defluviitaleaceae bacterium]MCL2273894.1 hypothetical protein [Defluviitaleaceae bacterium]
MEAAVNLEKQYFDEMQKIKLQLLNREIPDVYPQPPKNRRPKPEDAYYVDRYEFVNLSAFAQISKRWVQPLAKYIGNTPCLEIMAGKGVLAKALSDCGVQIRATDNFAWEWVKNTNATDAQTLKEEDVWYNVAQLDGVESVEKYGTEIGFLLCCWPSFQDPTIHNALIKMREVNPSCKLIYIGEPKGGCTANDDFFNAVKWITNDEQFNKMADLYQRWHIRVDKPMLAQ